jgi:hypothetical protein
MRFIAKIANHSDCAGNAWSAKPIYVSDGYVWYVPTDPYHRLVYEACVAPCITDIVHDSSEHSTETFLWAMKVSPTAVTFSRVYR